MVTSCLFGIFVFASPPSLIYRFLTDELITYLYKCFMERKYELAENNIDNDEILFSIDDAILIHLSSLLNFYQNTCARRCPIKRITLESNIQVFFDQIGKNKIICMADESFNTLVVLKTINLFKSLIKFHLGALSFTKSPTINKSIDRISASLQYYLNNVTTNQCLLFESSEYLHINFLIRQQCTEACAMINQIIQQSSTILITCKDKIVHLQSSNEQNRLSNSDIFLLLLSNRSRSLRTQFLLQDNNVSKTIGHLYKTKPSETLNENLTSSEALSSDDLQLAQARRANSLPTFSVSETTETNDTRSIETIFMKTSNKTLAPFTLYTISLTNDISVLILVEWKISLACSCLSEFNNQLNLCINQLQFAYKKLNSQVKVVETNATIRRYFEGTQQPSNHLSSLLNKTHGLYKTLPKKTEVLDEEDQKGSDILENLILMNDRTIHIFHELFFNTNYASLNENTILQPNTIQQILNRLLKQLGDWFLFLETKSQGNITISFCQHDFPGLVHFVLIDRSRGRIYTPVLFTEEYKQWLINNGDKLSDEYIKERKIIAFELECLAALQRGCTSYTMTDEYFTYNYTLRLQESNGASMRLYRPFIKTEPPGILYYDFYEKLAYENYAAIGDQTSIVCFELICVHLRFVPPNIVHEHCEQLWPKLMELDE